MTDKQNVTLRAKDGSTGECAVLETKDGKVTVEHVTSKKKYTMTEAVFKSSTVEQLDESSMHPAAAIWPNQMVRVYEKNTNKQVDQGLVTKVNPGSIFIHTEEYKKDGYSFLVLA